MKKTNEVYCHIIGKRIKISQDSYNKSVSFEPKTNDKICIENNGICNMNCDGCKLL